MPNHDHEHEHAAHDHHNEVTVERESPVRTRVEIVIPAEDVNVEFARQFKELGAKVAMPGFRKGHVPRKLLEQRYGKQVAREVTEQLAQHAFFHAVDDHKLPVVAQPVYEPIIAVKGEPLKIVARVEVKPEFEVKNLDGITAKRETTTVTDARVEEQVERLRKQMAQVRTVEDRPVQKGDVVRADYKGSVPDEGGDALEGKDVQLEVGAGRFLPPFEEKLLGLARGAHAIDVTFPDDFDREKLRGKAVHFDVEIKDILELVLPALDDDFAKDVDESITGVEALRTKIREQLEVSEKDRAEAAVREQIVEQVLEKNPFEVPPSLVDRYLAAMLEDTRARLQRRGLTQADLANLDPQRIVDEMRPQAQRAAATQLLMETLSKQEKIEVTDDEVEEKLQEIAKESGSQIAKVRAYYRKEGRFETLRYQVRDDKALAYLVGRSQITEVTKEP